MQEQIAEIIELIKMLPEPERAAYLSRLHDIAAPAEGSGKEEQ